MTGQKAGGDAVKRVLVVSNMYPTAEHSAGGIFVHEQVKALRRHGIDARVITGRTAWMPGRRPWAALRVYARARREAWPGWDEHDGVPVARFPFLVGTFSRPWLYPWIYAAALRRWLPELAEGFAYDIVHTHTAFIDGRAGIAAARLRGVPMVLTEHTGPLSTITADWRWRLHTQAGVDGADRLVAVSHALRRDMLAQLAIADPDRVVVMPNGVDTSFFDPARPAAERPVLLSELEPAMDRVARAWSASPTLRTGVDLLQALREALAQEEQERTVDDSFRQPGAVHALWVGHHVEVKAVDRLLDAFAIARRHEPRLVLTLLGSGPMEPGLHQQAQALQLEHAVRFRPAADREGVRTAMATADFLVLPSHTETFGVVAIESLAMGKPVLATACGGPEDVLADPQLGMFTGNNLHDIALGLQRMARSIGRFDARSIRSAAVTRYDYAHLARQLSQLYDELASTAAG